MMSERSDISWWIAIRHKNVNIWGDGVIDLEAVGRYERCRTRDYQGIGTRKQKGKERSENRSEMRKENEKSGIIGVGL